MTENDTMPETSPPEGSQGLSLRDVLRAESNGRHQRLDRLFDGLDGSDISAYRRFVLMNEACHRVAEPLIAASPLAGALPEASSGPRAECLARDVAALGLARLAPEAFPLPTPDLEEAAGISYVLEGSRLGARFIHRRLKERVGDPLSPWFGMPLAYLESAEEPDRFRPLMTRLEQLLLTDGQRIRAAAAANATFDYFIAVERLASVALSGHAATSTEGHRTA